MLVGNALSVSILQWAVMPLLQPLLGPWLIDGTQARPARSAVGAALILIALAGLVALFRWAGG